MNKCLVKVTVKVTGMHPKIKGKISIYLSGDVSGLSGDVTVLRGDVSVLSGDVSECEITEEERNAGIDISVLVAK